MGGLSREFNPVSIPPERHSPVLNAVLGDDLEGDRVSGVDLPLRGTDETVVDLEGKHH